MKYSIIFLALILIISCKSNEDINKTEPYKDTIILIGPIDETGFNQEPFNSWYNPNYEDYVVDASSIDELKSLTKDIEIKTFMGTWCGDSKREIPNFLKILKAIDFREKNHSLIAVNRDKATPEHLEKDLNITNVPTFIFYKDGVEINRIVEYPIETLEKDMIAILSDKAYKHAYAE